MLPLPKENTSQGTERSEFISNQEWEQHPYPKSNIKTLRRFYRYPQDFLHSDKNDTSPDIAQLQKMPLKVRFAYTLFLDYVGNPDVLKKWDEDNILWFQLDHKEFARVLRLEGKRSTESRIISRLKSAGVITERTLFAQPRCYCVHDISRRVPDGSGFEKIRKDDPLTLANRYIAIPSVLLDPNHPLYKDLPLESAGIYAELWHRSHLSRKKDQFQDQGRTYSVFTIESICKAFGFGKERVKKALEAMISHGLAERNIGPESRAYRYFLYDYLYPNVGEEMMEKMVAYLPPQKKKESFPIQTPKAEDPYHAGMGMERKHCLMGTLLKLEKGEGSPWCHMPEVQKEERVFDRYADDPYAPEDDSYMSYELLDKYYERQYGMGSEMQQGAAGMVPEMQQNGGDFDLFAFQTPSSLPKTALRDTAPCGSYNKGGDIISYSQSQTPRARATDPDLADATPPLTSRTNLSEGRAMSLTEGDVQTISEGVATILLTTLFQNGGEMSLPNGKVIYIEDAAERHAEQNESGRKRKAHGGEKKKRKGNTTTAQADGKRNWWDLPEIPNAKAGVVPFDTYEAFVAYADKAELTHLDREEFYQKLVEQDGFDAKGIEIGNWRAYLLSCDERAEDWAKNARANRHSSKVMEMPGVAQEAPEDTMQAADTDKTADAQKGGTAENTDGIIAERKRMAKEALARKEKEGARKTEGHETALARVPKYPTKEEFLAYIEENGLKNIVGEAMYHCLWVSGWKDSKGAPIYDWKKYITVTDFREAVARMDQVIDEVQLDAATQLKIERGRLLAIKTKDDKALQEINEYAEGLYSAAIVNDYVDKEVRKQAQAKASEAIGSGFYTPKNGKEDIIEVDPVTGCYENGDTGTALVTPDECVSGSCDESQGNSTAGYTTGCGSPTNNTGNGIFSNMTLDEYGDWLMAHAKFANDRERQEALQMRKDDPERFIRTMRGMVLLAS